MDLQRALSVAGLELSQRLALSTRTEAPSQSGPAPAAPPRPDTLENFVLQAPNNAALAGVEPPPSLVSGFANIYGNDHAAELFGKEQLAKALKEGVAYSKATSGDLAIPDRRPSDPKSLFIDPFSTAMQLGYRERPRLLPDNAIEILASRTWPVTATVKTRINQMVNFTTPQRTNYKRGYRLRLRDPDAKLSHADRKERARLEEVVWNCGSVASNRGRPKLPDFTRIFMRDSMMFDAASYEKVPNRKGEPCEWLAVDAKSIRYAETGATFPVDDPEQVKYVQVYDGIIIQQYTDAELAYCIRNPRSDIRWLGYGTPEIEECITAITSLLSAIQYNRNQFQLGISSKGLLNLQGTMTEQQLRAFRSEWYTMLSGVENAFRTPVTNLEKIQYVPLSASQRDMEYAAYVEFLLKVVCSIFLIDSAEINFKFGNTGQKNMIESAQKAKGQESRQKGLRPLLQWYAGELNRHIVSKLNSDFVLEFVGLEEMTEKEQADLRTQRARSTDTVDELRVEDDKDPLPDGLGQVLLDPGWLSARRDYLMQKQQEEQQAQMMAQQQAMSTGAADALGGHGGPEAMSALVAQLEQQAASHQSVTGEVPGSDEPGKPATKKKPKTSVKKSLVEKEDAGMVRAIEVRI